MAKFVVPHWKHRLALSLLVSRVIVVDGQFVADNLFVFSYFSLFYTKSAHLSSLKL
jgi:hypothetical protein